MQYIYSEQRIKLLRQHHEAIERMLMEKTEHYGHKGGFYESNKKGDYAHALGEAKLKIDEFRKTGNQRMLIKAMAWLYLVFEEENTLDPR